MVAEVGHDLVVIDAVDRHIEVEPVADGGEEVGGGDVLRLAGSGVDGRDVGGGADLAAGDHLMAEGHGPGLGQHHIVVLLVEFLQHVVDAGGVEGADGGADEGEHVLFVDGEPKLCPVAEIFKHDLREIDKGVGRLGVAPAALFLEGRRQVEVVHRHQRLDAVFEALVDDVVVVLDALGVNSTCPLGDQPRPGDRKAVGLKAHLGHQRDVFLVMVVLVGRDLEIGGALGDLLDVLDRRALAVFEGRALDLVGGRRRAPEEIGGEVFVEFCHKFVPPVGIIKGSVLAGTAFGFIIQDFGASRNRFSDHEKPALPDGRGGKTSIGL